MKNEIGTDPTMVDVIETLDVPVPEKKIEPKNENKQNNNDKKPEKKGSFIKNLLFIILVLALMGGVAFGVYYYLRLAKNNENNVNVTPAFNLNKMQINEGDEIPQSLSEYGDFSKIDISNCKLDTSEVKNNVPGNYTYYVMCNGPKYSESFVVKSKDGSDEPIAPTVTKRLNVTTYFNYTIKGEHLNIERLISSDDNLTFSFKDKETESFYDSGKSKVFPQEIQKRALLKLDALSYATNIKDLKAPPSNHLEKLSGNLQGFYNIRINVKYRIIFKFDTNAYEVSILDYH